MGTILFGKGTSISWNGNTIAQLTSIGNPEISTDSIDVTTHQSVDRFREFVAGLSDAGSVAIEGYSDITDTAGQQAIYADAGTGTIRPVVVTGPGGSYTFSFNAFATSVKPIGDAPIDDKLAFSATIKITGKPNFALSTSAGLTTPYFEISDSAVITPVAIGSKYDYVATVLTGISSVTITPTAAAGTITINGNVVASGVASSAIPLGLTGSITTVTIVVTETSKAPKTYTIRIARAAS